MSSFNDEDERNMPPAYGTENQQSARKELKRGKKLDDDDNTETESSNDGNKNNSGDCKIWLQVLPSKGGMLLAVLLTEIMTEGMNSEQMNILGNFISSVGSLISYKAARDNLDFD